MESLVKPLNKEHYIKAVNIFAEAFEDDPLFLFSFPGSEQRRRLTRIMYEFVVFDMVPNLNLVMKGALIDNSLAGCIIYSTPESHPWSERMKEPLLRMRKKANDERIDIIGEYARLPKYDPEALHFYGNELAVGRTFRKLGIGKKLNDTMVYDCKNHPEAKGIVIDTANENNVARYEKWGWELKASGNFYSIKYFVFWIDC